MTTDYGSGIYLTNSSDIDPRWDMDVTNSGDIRTVSGTDELQKDVALSTTIRVGGELGSRVTPTTRNRIRARVLDALDDDNRINSVLSIDVSKVGTGLDEVEVAATVNSVQNETIELIFEVAE